MNLLQDKFEKHKVCIVVPTYNNAQTLAGVLESLLKFTSDILVVNDGSTDNTVTVLERFPSVNVIGYSQNQGKGFALRTGFDHAYRLGFEYAITIDSDGQHYADDLVHFLEAMKENPNAIIIGARNMDQAHIPGKSTFGNKFSSFWFWVNTGIRRNDTQSGYRLYPISAMKGIDFKTKKFEFEIEVLVRSAWRGIEVIEVPVKVYYPEEGQRISHFRPFRDFMRITVLNTVLVFIAFLYIKPRDFFRRIKKKMSDSCSTSFSLSLERPTK